VKGVKPVKGVKGAKGAKGVKGGKGGKGVKGAKGIVHGIVTKLQMAGRGLRTMKYETCKGLLQSLTFSPRSWAGARLGLPPMAPAATPGIWTIV
jgi:hypothetical protein